MEDIMILVCPVILLEKMIKGLKYFYRGSCSRKVSFLPSLVAIGTVMVKI